MVTEASSVQEHDGKTLAADRIRDASFIDVEGVPLEVAPCSAHLDGHPDKTIIDDRSFARRHCERRANFGQDCHRADRPDIRRKYQGPNEDHALGQEATWPTKRYRDAGQPY